MDPSEPSPSGTVMASSAQSQRRARKPSAKPAGTWVVERVDSVTGILEPEITMKKWRACCGVIARTRVPITRSQWSDVTQAERKTLYAELKQSFRVPDEAEEAFRRASLHTIGKCWRNFKHRLLMDFMKTNKLPLGLYPFVSESEWEEFCRLKSSEEFQSESLKGRELAKKNRHPHLLGTSGYVGAKKKWAKKDEEAEKYDHEPIFSDFTEERGRNWCRARVKVTPSGECVWLSPEEEEVYKKMVGLKEQASQGSFVPQRERNILSEAIGTKEPTGRTRGLKNLASWGKAFSGDKDERWRQRKRAKAEVMKQEIMDSLKAEFEAKMAAMEERLASQTVKEMVPLASPRAHRSS